MEPSTTGFTIHRSCGFPAWTAIGPPGGAPGLIVEFKTIDADDLDRILELAEDMADIRAAEQARAEMQSTGATPIPWDEVKADLGLT